MQTNSDKLQTITWFFQNFILKNKVQLLVIVFFGLTAALMQGSILVLINSMINNRGLIFNLHTFLVEHHIDITINHILFLLIFCGLIISSTFIFLQAQQTLRLWKKYQIYITNQLLDSLNDAVKRGLVLDIIGVKKLPIANVLKGTQRIGLFTRLVTNSILPAMRFLTFSAFVFYSQPILSAIIYFVALPIGGLILYFSAKNASGNDYGAELLTLSHSKEIDSRVEAAIKGDVYRIDKPQDVKSSAITIRIDKLLSSVISAERTRLLVSILAIVILGFVSVFSGVITQEEIPGEFLVYLVGLILALSQLSNVLAIASHFGRFYPTVYRYKMTYDWLNLADSNSSITSMMSNVQYKYVSATNEDDLIS